MTNAQEWLDTNIPDNLNDYLKPLGVVWAKMNTAEISFYHVGVYLGNRTAE